MGASDTERSESAQIVPVVNAGSGTIDVTAFRVDGAAPSGDATDPEPVWQLDVVRHTDPQQITVTADGSTVEYEAAVGDLSGALAPGLELLWRGPGAMIADPGAVALVGHRIVHGGARTQPAELTPEVRAEITELDALAPLHNRVGLDAAEVARRAFPTARHVAVFDTSFHTTIPAAAAAFGLPIEWAERGLRRYGFHGISHRDAAIRTARLLDRPLDDVEMITVHLGGGCSAAAVRHGRSVDTTMGATPTDGMVMATRSGSVDPGVLFRLLRQDGMDVDRLEQVVNRESGLMGLTGGRTGDIGVVHDLAEGGDESARFAQEVYVRSIAKEMSGLRPALDRLDAVVFTGGAVEQEPWLRRRIAHRLRGLGLRVDDERNESAVGRFGAVDVASTDSDMRVVVLEAAENLAIARCITASATDVASPS